MKKMTLRLSYIPVFCSGILLGGLFVGWLSHKRHLDAITTFLSSQLSIDTAVATSLRSGATNDALNTLESEIGANLIGILDLHDWSIHGEMTKRHPGIKIGALYVERWQLDFEDPEMQRLVHAAIDEIAK